MKIIIILCLVTLFLLQWGWHEEVKHLEDQLRINENIIHDLKIESSQISITLEKYVRKCGMKKGGSFPVITIEPYDQLRLRCFQFWEGDFGSWTELEMNPTFSLPLEANP